MFRGNRMSKLAKSSVQSKDIDSVEPARVQLVFEEDREDFWWFKLHCPQFEDCFSIEAIECTVEYFFFKVFNCKYYKSATTLTHINVIHIIKKATKSSTEQDKNCNCRLMKLIQYKELEY